MDSSASTNSINTNTKTTSLSSIISTKEQKCCVECKKPIKGKFVRALEGMFHLDCFRCMDCKEICLTKFFPFKIEDGTFRPLCENDYYKRLDLVCAKCGNALLDSHVNAIGKKYHIEHFCCAKCSVVFKSQDLYYEHNGDIYCQKDYSILYASKCGSCRTSVLKQYIEYNNNKTKTIEKLHLDCYMIYKSWNVRMVPEYVPIKVYNTVEEEFKDRNRMEERVSKIWSILSSYMQSSAECMSKLLSFINSHSVNHEMEQANSFVYHIEVLFNALDEIETKMRQYKDSTGLKLQNEPRELVKKIIYFFSTISHSTGIPHDYTKEFLSLITLLAQTLKLLIRAALNCTIKLEYSYNETEALESFLKHISGIGNLHKDMYFYSKYSEVLEKEMRELNTEYCSHCKQYIDDECVSNNNYRWHINCFKCTTCGKVMIDDKKEISGSRVKTEDNSIILACPDCIQAQNIPADNLLSELEYISDFKQYNVLLRTSLKRLYILCPPKKKMSSSVNKIKVTISKNNRLLSKTKLNCEDKNKPTKKSKDKVFSADNLPSICVTSPEETSNKNCNETTPTDDTCEIKQSGSKSSEKSEQSELSKETKSSETTDKTLVNPVEVNKYEFDNSNSPDSEKYPENNNNNNNNNSNNAYANPYADTYNDHIYQSTNQKIEEENAENAEKQDTVKDLDFKLSKDNNEVKGSNTSLSKFKRPIILPDNIITIQRNATENYQQPICISSLPLDENQILISDLSAFEMLAAGQKIVECLDNLLRQENLSNQIDISNLLLDKKETMWGKLLGSLKQNQKKQKVKDKVFGANLEYLTEKHGIESKFGAGNGNIRIPILIEKLIASMRGMDLNVEGIYRKNGNIKQLKLLSDEIDKNPDEINLKGNSAIQLAALMKKFLRELPNPVLTFKLHQLFTISQKASTEENSMKILNYACCLLPKCHRDLLEVLLLFLKHISTLTDSNNNVGTKMNSENLATVIAPNILYSKYKDPAKDESMLAIKAVKILIEHPELSFIVPENVVNMLNLNEEKENNDDIVIANNEKTETPSDLPNNENENDIQPEAAQNEVAT